MPNQILLDNWTLQEISHLNQLGLSTQSSDKIVIDKMADTHHFEKLTHGFVQLYSLFSFLQNIVLRETIITDAKFAYVWKDCKSLLQLESYGLIKIHAFQEEKFLEVRKAIVEQLCITSSIRKIQRLNEEEWETNEALIDKFMSAIIWGGAGMLARGHVYETFYLPHPLRGYAFQQSPIAKRDAFTETLSFISSNQTKLLYFDCSTSSAIKARFSLPPLISQIIEESNNFDDLFSVALQLRERYSDLRLWLKTFQESLDTENSKGISKHIKTLQSVQKYIEDKYSPDKYGKLDLSFDFLSLSPSISVGAPINKLINRVGIRSTINDLILTNTGYSSIKKLLKLLDEEHSELGKKVYDEVIQNFSS